MHEHFTITFHGLSVFSLQVSFCHACLPATPDTTRCCMRYEVISRLPRLRAHLHVPPLQALLKLTLTKRVCSRYFLKLIILLFRKRKREERNETNFEISQAKTAC